jgi:anhydro-N-acetylmuramic acid kinase
MTDHYEITGTMSGTSLDGLDAAYCIFDRKKEKWNYTILHAKTFEYPEEWKKLLLKLEIADARQLARVHAEYGKYCGTLINSFVSETDIKPDYIASHGHTIFHRPDLGYTFQLGDGAAIATTTGITTICDFRTADVALGGQGAPLVPIGDKLLFSDFNICLNIGGFANISYDEVNQRIAFDICPANIILNILATKSGNAFDKDGEIAASGIIIPELLQKLENIPYYLSAPPKSLGKEWLVREFLPVLDFYSEYPNPDLMRTVTEHIGIRIGKTIEQIPCNRILITGGGALNKFLIERVRSNTAKIIKLPDLLTIQFKEALIFGFLGILRLRGENNCLSSVTGATKDHCSGSVYFAKQNIPNIY